MDKDRMFFVQTSTLTPGMHQKLNKHGKYCMQNNQLPTQSLVELMDNSIVVMIANNFMSLYKTWKNPQIFILLNTPKCCLWEFWEQYGLAKQKEEIGPNHLPWNEMALILKTLKPKVLGD